MDILITLTMTELNRYNVIKRLIAKKISEEEARKLIGLKSVRQIRRIRKRVMKEGVKALAHGNRGKRGNRKFNVAFTDKIMGITKGLYSDFKPTLASEKLLENHGLRISKESMRQLMIKEGLWKGRPRKESKDRHAWRERKGNYGEMQQFDGSYHLWFEDRGGESCLLLAVDDATGKITHAKFDKNEGTAAVFLFWMEYFEKNGLPLSVYLDRFSTYKINHPSAVDNKELMTQFQRAMRQTGVNLITAYSPQAKGRVERMNGTLQDRLVKELRLAGISTIDGANEFLKTFIPKFNAKFAVVPRNQADFHRVADAKLKEALPRIFSIQSQRKVNNDYTVMLRNRFFQLEEKQPVTVFKKDTVTVEEHLNGETKIRLRDKCLNYLILPERPKKVSDLPIVALTNRPSGYKPPANHPWRRMVLSPAVKYGNVYQPKPPIKI